MSRELRITREDMALFADGSGDHSPLHTDPEFARRTAFGECIVFGGLLTVAMLGLLPEPVLTGLRLIRSQFPGPVLPDTGLTATVQARGAPEGDWEVRLRGRGKILARLIASAQAEPPTALHLPELQLHASGCACDGDPDTICGQYRTSPQLNELAGRLNASALPAALLEGVAWASNAVGSSLPDFDGLCAAVTVFDPRADPASGAAEYQWLRTRDYDPRSDRLLLEGVLSDASGRPRCSGLIECFPFGPTTPSELARKPSTTPMPVRGTVVVIGASRGAGAALTLALLAAGWTVHGVYSCSRSAAADLERRAGLHAARLVLHRADAADPAALAAVAAAAGPTIDGVALCAAPPPLAMGLAGDSAPELVRYVADSLALATSPIGTLLPLLSGEHGWLVVYSAPASAMPTRDLPQYGVAKAALEGLGRWAAVAAPRARILLVRPPRMRTDLINTPAARRAATAPEVVADAVVRRLSENGRSPGAEVLELEPVAV